MNDDRSFQEPPSSSSEIDLTATDAPAEVGERSIDDVTREAEALLDEVENGVEKDIENHRSTDELVADVERTLDLVDALVDEANLLDSNPDADPDSETPTVETSDIAAEALDLTVTLPETPVEPEDQVPDHGSEGPAVDLFAAPESDPQAVETPSANPRLIFEDDRRSGPTPDSRSGTLPQEEDLLHAMTEKFGSTPSELPEVPASERALESPSAGRRSARDAAASRLQDLLTARLAEEYDSVEAIGASSPSVEESMELETAPDPTVVESPAADAESSAQGGMAESTEGRTMLPDAIDFDVETSAAVEQEAALEFIEPVQAPTTSKVLKEEHADSADPSDSSMDSPAPTVPGEQGPGSEGDVEDVVEEDSDQIEPSSEADSEVIEDPTGTEGESQVPTESGSATQPRTRSASQPERAAEVRTEAEPEVEPEPRPEPASEVQTSVQDEDPVEIDDEPSMMSRLATPLALSLLAWVPLVWAYALMAPAPEPVTTDVLSVGIIEPGVAPKESRDSPEPPTSSE